MTSKRLCGIGLLIIYGLYGCTTMRVDNAEQNLMVNDAAAFAGECKKQLQSAQEILNTIVKSENASEATVLVPFNKILIHLNEVSSKGGLFANVHPNEAVRTEAEKCEQEASKFSTDLTLNQDLYSIFKKVDPSSLDDEGKRFLRLTLDDFKRSGVDKDEKTREKIKKLNEMLVEIGQNFGRNIREDVRSITLTSSADLKGLPPDFIASHKPAADGTIKITTDYPDYIPFMTYADNRELRKKLAFESLNRGYPKNESVLKAMIDGRYDLAKTLGYASYATYVVEDKMIKTPKAAADFIDQITTAAIAAAEVEYKDLLAKKKELVDAGATVVEGFEKAYLEEKLKQTRFDFNSQLTRPYFQYEKVLEGLLNKTSQMFGISYRKLNMKLWHESVLAYDVYEGTSKLGRIYLDLHPRENKYKHAAQFTLKSGVKDVQLPEGVLVCNFADPKTSNPALMDHDQVVTFFHEFGHLLHHILGGKQKWIRFSGVATEWDFVEAPSQLFEEWAWDENVLQSFAKHYQTGEPIPSALVEKMRKADEFGKGLDARQQMFYAALSLNYYDKDPKTFEPLELLKELQAKYGSFPYFEGTHFNLNFGHLEGYSAMYYTYMWSKVIAKDLFSKFKSEGMNNPDVAMRYANTILKMGGSRDAADLVANFLGRPYNFDAFRAWLLTQ